jgi:hypothetical protein
VAWSAEAEAIVESCEAYTRRIWWGALVGAVILVILAQRLLRDPSWASPPGWGSALALLVAAGGVPHLIYRLALSNGRLERLRRQPVDLHDFAQRDSLLLLRAPFRVGLEFRRPIPSSAAAAVPETERSLLNVLRSVTRWSVARIHLMVLTLAGLALCMNVAKLGVSSGFLVVVAVVLMLTCFPRIRAWAATPRR